MNIAAQEYQNLNCRKGWCKAAQKFAAGHPTLGSAWRSCKNGTFLAYWIGIQLDTSTTVWRELIRLRMQIGLPFTLQGGSADQRARFATAIRARFNSDGTYRKRSKA